jgi:hypothetical protein
MERARDKPLCCGRAQAEISIVRFMLGADTCHTWSRWKDEMVRGTGFEPVTPTVSR